MDVIALLDMLLTFLTIAIFARVIVSWIAPRGGINNPIANIIYQITEPILMPFRRIIPRIGMFDLTPMAAMFTIWGLGELVKSAAG